MTEKPKQPRSMAADIIDAVRECTKKWTKTVKAEERSPASRLYRLQRMTRERGISIKEAAAQIMEEAYLKMSGNGEYPAKARQIMYAARPHILKVTGLDELNDDYFTQTVLPDFMSDNPELTAGWDVVYDARGHFSEPHGGRSFGIGTLEVRDYLAGLHDPKLVEAALAQANVKKCGPSGNFGGVLFCEKEGFDPLLERARIADKHDLALMSTKGMSVTAARLLADVMCHKYDIPLYLVTDFDKAAFSIAGTLQRDTRRYQFQNDIKVIHLGLRLADVEAMGLEKESEYQHHPKGNKAALIANLRENGATEADIAFMFRDFDRLRSTRRVELNAMTSPQFVAFLERKLKKHGVKNIIPEQKLLAEAYVGIERGRRLQEAIDDLTDEIDESDFKAPKDLRQRVATLRKQRPAMRWDAALAEISNQQHKRVGRK